MPDVSAQPVRVVKRAERDHAATVPSTLLGQCEALERNLQRLINDVHEKKHALATGQPVPVTKSREAVPALVNLIFVLFPTE